MVAEAPGDDGDTTYVESGTVGHKDLYAYQDLSGTPAAIMAVQLADCRPQGRCRQPQPARGAQVGGTTANGATRVLGTSYAVYDDRFEVDPATGPRGPKLASTRYRPGLRWSRDGRAAESGCVRGTAAGRPRRRR